MAIKIIEKSAFAVIGKLGSTADGAGFIQRLWADANEHFAEVAPLAKLDENGTPVGFWGAMSDLSGSFRPWEDGFSKGLYLAGVEVRDDADAPDGWTKWVIPGFEFVRAEVTSETTFTDTLRHLEESGLSLVGAAHDFTDPSSGKNYMFFPIRKL